MLDTWYDLKMQLPIQVECYAGHKADETPRRFLWQGEWVEVVEVLDRWYQVESRPEWPRADYFKVLGSNQGEYLLKHDLESDRWYLGRQWSPPRRPEPEGEAPQ
jgi:hypothetical protein